MKKFESGTFYAGCNYWASDSGMYMWRRWNEKTVENDFKLLSEIGVRMVRVFPLWPDFQPVKKIFGWNQVSSGFSVDGDTLLATTDDGIDSVMMDRFEKLLDIAQKYDLLIVPALLTGWMSGRLFVPPALENKNLISNPFAIRWEVRFVRAFVNRFKSHPAVYAWCLGNECNCMSPVKNREQAYLWMQSISDAIRGCDNTRPVLSGMHSQYCPGEDKWVLQDCGESCDLLTTHPYASPSYSTDRDHTNTIKVMLHPASQNLYYKGIGQKPSIIEETGTYGQQYCDDEVVAKYAEGCLYTSWAHDCLAWLWWIGFDQGSLTYHPFGYNNRASNYGLYREDGTLKPVGEVVKKFNAFLDKFPYKKLPQRIVDGVCILTQGQNSWNAAGASFILAKQAGLDIDFAYANDKIPKAAAYFIPSMECNEFGFDKLYDLMDRVKEGAVMYLSIGNGTLRNLHADWGFHIKNREYLNKEQTVNVADVSLPLHFEVKFNIDIENAEVLATDDSGAPVFLRSAHGKGQLFFLMAPLETAIYEKTDVFEMPYYKFYAEMAKYLRKDKIMSSDNPMVGLTEHPVNETERVVIATAYTENGTTATFTAQDGWCCDGLDKKQNFEGSETKVYILKKKC